MAIYFFTPRCVSAVPTNPGHCGPEPARYGSSPPTNYNYKVVHNIPYTIPSTGRTIWYLPAVQRVNVQRGMILGVKILSPTRIATVTTTGNSIILSGFVNRQQRIVP